MEVQTPADLPVLTGVITFDPGRPGDRAVYEQRISPHYKGAVGRIEVHGQSVRDVALKLADSIVMARLAGTSFRLEVATQERDGQFSSVRVTRIWDDGQGDETLTYERKAVT